MAQDSNGLEYAEVLEDKNLRIADLEAQLQDYEFERCCKTRIIRAFRPDDLIVVQLSRAVTDETMRQIKQQFEEVRKQTGLKMIVIDSSMQVVPIYNRIIQKDLAAATAHRACCGSEHDPQNGKLHGCCIVCGVTWPCETAKVFLRSESEDRTDAERS
jgi:hypothetical protein